MSEQNVLYLQGEDLERGNAPIIEYAERLLPERLAAGGEIWPIPVTVVYHRPHAQPDEPEWSEPDRLLVGPDGGIEVAPPAE